MDHIYIRRALLSVSDKTGIVEFARALSEHRIEIISTGGTAKLLRESGIAVVEVADHTGFPEMMGGRLKTLHPVVQGGILGRRGRDEGDMQKYNMPAIDMIVVNLYPFAETVASGADFKICIENIDIGGPTMLRGAAKNYDRVAVVPGSAYYADLLREMHAHNGALSLETRRDLAQATFRITREYDQSIEEWFPVSA